MKKIRLQVPKTPGLYAQVTILLTLILLLGALVSTSYSQYRLQQKNQLATQARVAALADGLAASLKEPLLLNDTGRQKQVLSHFTRIPGVISTEIVDLDGNSLFQTFSENTGLTSTLDQRRTFTVPDSLKPSLSRLDRVRKIEAWHPVMDRTAVGWVRVEFSLVEESLSTQGLWVDSMLGSLGITVITLAILLLFLKRSLDPIHRAALFAKQLATSAGATFEVKGTSKEVEALEQALNFASLKLKSQYDTLTRRDAEMRAVLETAADAVIGLDESGCVRLFNPAATSMFGPDAEQIEGRQVSEIIPCLNTDELRQLMSQAVNVGNSVYRVTRLSTNGLRNGDVEFPIEIALAEVATSSNLRYTLLVRDVTEQRMANEHLQIYVRALECSSHGAVICDARLPGAPMVWVNSAFMQITGYDLDELTGRNCSFLQAHERGQPEVQQLKQAIATGQGASVVIRNYRKNGELFWNQLSIAPVADENGSITHFVGAVSDITQRILAERAIEQRKEQLDLILRLSPDGFVMFDRDDRFVYANTSFIQMTGIPAERFHADLNPEILESLLQSRVDPKVPWDPLWRESAVEEERLREITLIWPERRILAFDVRRGDSSGDRVLFMRDVTRESEVDRMKSEFLSTAAHELRTPLVSILGFAELLLHRHYSPEKSKMMIETIHKQSGLIVNLINELLDLARIEARQGKDFRIENQALQPIIGDAVNSLVIPGDGRKVSLKLPAEPVYAVVDAEKFRQSLMNVLSNAYKYSPNGGKISLSMQLAHRRGLDMVGIQVSDQGIGMSPEQQSRAFERFFRADPSGNIPGTGLGLCIVKEIIELLGGHVDLQSEKDKGTQVTLWLPMRSGTERIQQTSSESSTGALGESN